MRADAQIVLHLPAPMAQQAELAGFPRLLRDKLTEAGARMEIRVRDTEALGAMGDTPDLHIVWQGRIRHSRALNTAVAYIFPFWYLDPMGVYGESSLTQARFDPAEQDADACANLMARLTNRLVIPRKSRFDQPETDDVIPDNCIAVFLQGWSAPTERLRYITEEEMVAAVLADTGGRPVVLKPHPNTRDPETFEMLARLSKRPNVTVTFGNIHDILAKADLSVSLCSSVSLEGMLHGCPAVLFGRSDFHHCAATAKTAAEWPNARDRALGTDWPFAAFLHWFLEKGMLNASRSEFTELLAARIAQNGIDLAPLSLDHLGER
jgi:hypothetical protein